MAGFMTTKGELVRGILFPKPIQFRFYSDLVQVATLFLIIGLGGMIYSMFTWIKNGVSYKFMQKIYLTFALSILRRKSKIVIQ